MKFIRFSENKWASVGGRGFIERTEDNALEIWTDVERLRTIPPAYAEAAAKALGLDDWKGDGLAGKDSTDDGLGVEVTRGILEEAAWLKKEKARLTPGTCINY